MSDEIQPVLFEERHKEYIEVAEKALKDLLGFDPESDDFGDGRLLILKTQGVMGNEAEIAELIKIAGEKIAPERVDLIEMEADFSEEQVRELRTRYKFMFNASNKFHRGKLFNDIGKTDVRLVSPVGADISLFEPGGVMSTGIEEIENRLVRMKEKLGEDVYGYRITSVEGTDLMIKMRPNTKWGIDSGKIAKGSWSNWPGGEIYTTPDVFGTNGVMVLRGVDNADSQYVTTSDGELIVIEMQSGKIISITGGTLAERLSAEFDNYMLINAREYFGSDKLGEIMDILGINKTFKDGKIEGNLTQEERRKIIREFKKLKYKVAQYVINIAELGIGVLENGPFDLSDGGSAPTVVVEKGCVHIGIGDQEHDGDRDGDIFDAIRYEDRTESVRKRSVDGPFPSSNHYDFPISRATVTRYRTQEDFENLTNGEVVVDNGKLML